MIDDQFKPSQRAFNQAKALLHLLAPLFPASVGAQARNPQAAQRWLNSWAFMIHANRLSDQEIQRGVTRLSDIDPDTPLSWPAFHKACKPHAGDLIDYNDPMVKLRNLETLAKYHGPSKIKLDEYKQELKTAGQQHLLS